MGKVSMKNSATSDASILSENSFETHLSMESRMRKIRTSGLTRGRTSAVIGLGLSFRGVLSLIIPNYPPNYLLVF